MSVEKPAIARAKAFYASEGYEVEDVSRVRGHNGYDLVATRDGITQKVEVKGCSRPWQIPDFFVTEFDENQRLVADVLCVVYFAPELKGTICLIPRDAIPAEFVVPKRGYRISGRFKKQSVLSQFARQVAVDDV